MEITLLSKKVPEQSAYEMFRSFVVWNDCFLLLSKDGVYQNGVILSVYNFIEKKFYGNLRFERADVHKQYKLPWLSTKNGSLFFSSCFNGEAYCTELVLNCHNRQMKMVSEWSENYYPHNLNLQRMSFTMCGLEPCHQFRILDLVEPKFHTITLPTKHGCIDSVPYFTAFVDNGDYVYIDDNCENVISVSLTDAAKCKSEKLLRQSVFEIPKAKKSRMSYVFADVVIVRDLSYRDARWFCYHKRKMTFHEITEYLQEVEVNPNKTYDSVKVSQDQEALYVFTYPKLFKVQIHGIDWSFLDGSNNEELQIVPEPNETSCPVCFERYGTPKIMKNCGHTICEACELVITVEPGLNQRKVLTCPICRVVTELFKTERLPMNWLVKSLIDKPVLPRPTNSVLCGSCSEAVQPNQVFDCKKCSADRSVPELLLCGACMFKDHASHISEVKAVKFLSSAARKSAVESVKTNINLIVAEKGLNDTVKLVIDHEHLSYCKHTFRSYRNTKKEANKLIAKITKCELITQNGLERQIADLRMINDKIVAGKETIDKMTKTGGDYAKSA